MAGGAGALPALLTGSRRLICLTDRGWLVAETILASLRKLQERWEQDVGTPQFESFLAVLRFLALEWDDKPS